MDLIDAFIIIGVAAFVHASFQLSVSVLTLLSSHTIGKNRSHAKLLRLIGSYLTGAAVMTTLLLSTIAFALISLLKGTIPFVVWASTCGLLIGIGVATWTFYYRKEQGTTLWLPRGLATYLSGRTKATHLSAEAFGLGLTGVFAELLFIIGPLGISALVLIQLPSLWQLLGIATYVAISLLSLLIVAGLIGSGHKISQIQRWRERNKRFLQFAGGGALMALGLYVYVETVVTPLSVIGLQ